MPPRVRAPKRRRTGPVRQGFGMGCGCLLCGAVALLALGALALLGGY